MLQYLQQLYGQRAMPGGVANMPAQNVPLGGQTNWMNPPQLADDSGMYGPTLSTLFGQAGATGAPNMVNAGGGYWTPNMGRPQQGPPPGYGSRGMSQPRAPAAPPSGSLGFNGPRPGGYMLGNQGPAPQSPMPTRPAMNGQAPIASQTNPVMIQNSQFNRQTRQQARQFRRLSRNSMGM